MIITQCRPNKCKYSVIRKCKKSNEYYCNYKNKLKHMDTIKFGKKTQSINYLKVGDIEGTYIGCPLLNKCYSDGNIYDLLYIYKLERMMNTRKERYRRYLKYEHLEKLIEYLSSIIDDTFSYIFNKKRKKIVINYKDKHYNFFLQGSVWTNSENYDLYRRKKATFFIKSRILGKDWKNPEGNFLQLM